MNLGMELEKDTTIRTYAIVVNNTKYRIHVTNQKFVPAAVCNQHVYIGRSSSSILHNPYSHKKSKFNVIEVPTVQHAVACYVNYANNQYKSNDKFRIAVNVLVNKLLSYKEIELSCFCAPEPCHGDALAELVFKLLRERLE